MRAEVKKVRVGEPTSAAHRVPKGATVLVAETDAATAGAWSAVLTAAGARVRQASSLAESVGVVQHDGIDAVVSGTLRGTGEQPLALLDALRRRGLRAASATVVVASYGRVDTAVHAMRQGAADFLVKPVEPDRLVAAVGLAVHAVRLTGAGQDTHDPLAASFIGQCEAIVAARRVIAASAGCAVPVLIVGEPGTGRTHVSHLIHDLSARPGLIQTCHAKALKPAQLEAACKKARRGTLVIEAISELRAATADALARLLDDDSDGVCRVIGQAASWEALAELEPGLVHRMSAVRVWLPPLRERGSDRVRLAEALLDRHARGVGRQRRLTDASKTAIARLDWPGHVRELDAAMQGAAASSDTVEVNWSPTPLQDPTQTRDPGDTLTARLARAEHLAILDALDAEQWHRTRTAKRLGINRATLYKKMRLLGMV